ncbi:MAG: response regulator [Acidobacteria bacterium]|nr:response regulator [Acidobacteriota bacterium]
MSKRKLLLADDSITIQKVVNLTFADEGIEVIAVGDGNSAMDKIREESPDLIMADVNMPGLNGYEICEKIRQSDEYKNIPVILLVGSFEPFDEAEAKRVGADDFLKKPFQSINQLVNTVAVLLDSESTAAYGSSPGEEAENITESDDEEFYGMDASSEDFSDPKIDDEMIETSRIEPAVDDFDSGADTAGEFAFSTSDIAQESADPDDDDFKEFTTTDTAEISEHSNEAIEDGGLGTDESVYSFEPEESYDTDLSAYDLDQDTPSSDEIDETAESTLGHREVILDEANLLELPARDVAGLEPGEISLEGDEHFETPYLHEAAFGTETEDTAVIEEEEISVSPEEEVSRYDEHVDTGDSATLEFERSENEKNGITAEMIEEISRRVAERLSGDALREVANEIVPQMAEKIIRQIAEEKMND